MEVRVPSPRFYYGWVIAAVSALVAFSSGPGQSYVFSVFIDPMIAETGYARSEVSLLYAVGTALSAAVVSLVGRAAVRHGPRRMILVTAGMLGAACLLLASAGSLLVFAVALALLRALGQGSLPINGTLLIAEWFERYRGRAVGVMGLGFATSAAILPVLSRALIDAVGWREAYAVLGMMVWLLVLPATSLLVRDTPESLGLRVDGGPSAAPAGAAPAAAASPDRRRVLRSTRFWALAIPLATPSFVVTALIFHQAGIFEERGLSATTAAAVFVPFAAASALFTLAAGALIDRWGPRRAFFFAMLLMLAAVLSLHAVDSVPRAIAYAALLGASSSVSQTTFGVIWAHFYGLPGLGRIQGSAMMIAIGAAALGPVPLALVHDGLGTFTPGVAALSLLPVLAMLGMRRARVMSEHISG
ncbi:MAG: MFS transporter [Chloroflexota bacterium]